MSQTPTIYLIDDDPAVVRLVARMLAESKFSIVEFSSGEEFLGQDELSDHGCVITDLHLPGISGTEIQAQLSQRGSRLALIVISGQADVPTAVQTMKLGAVTVLQKPFSPPQLIAAVEEGLARNRANRLRQDRVHSIQDRLAALNEDESQILQYLLRGESSKVISTQLNLSPRTVDRRRQSLLQKMDVETIPELVALWLTVHPGDNSP